ncbi:MAG: Serine-type D-Ala-D-Ala carboxypeptidase [Desulfotomaculum sp. 46_296]|nr:MAG: Serine-type D-Ala-D-Ala carboxypeptidase [Desulfotomaculum sp. 46_296]HAU31909.1 D-alanyl-D-alanine carboxypeptidase [Desulfotomaculum sp.]
MLLRTVLIILLLSFAVPPAAHAKLPSISADAAVMMDAKTGQVFFVKNPYKQRAPASLTKIMTAIIALENSNPSDLVTISKNAASVYEGQIINLHAGDKITLHNLLKAALIYSANDSTVAIAEHVADSEKIFLGMMNEKAKLIGAINTHFVNTNGYTHPNHYSTAYDLALITRYALDNPAFRKYVRCNEADVEWVEPKKSEKIYSTNRLLERGYPGIEGVKTGSTSAAGNCLIVLANSDGRSLITVVLDCYDRYRDTMAILDYGFNQIVSLDLCSVDHPSAYLPVRDGKESRVALVGEKNYTFDLLRSDLPMLKRNLDLVPGISAPVSCRQKLGKESFYLGDRKLASINLVAEKQVPRKGLGARLYEKIFGNQS